MKSNKPYSRVERVNKQILDILSGVLTKNVDLSFLGFVTFTDVDIAPDFKSAKIYYSILNPKLSNDQVNIEINKKRKAFKKYMSPQLHLKNIPDLRFYMDNSFEYGEKIERLLKNNSED